MSALVSRIMVSASIRHRSHHTSQMRTIHDMNYDKKCKEIIESKPNMMIPWYLMASHAYYTQDDPILSDGLYDELAQRMLSSWDNLKHIHKHIITKEDLCAGTLLTRKLPNRIEHAVKALRNE